MQAQGKHEEDALAAAVESFQQELKTDLKAVKAGGGPYQVRTKKKLDARGVYPAVIETWLGVFARDFCRGSVRPPGGFGCGRISWKTRHLR